MKKIATFAGAIVVLLFIIIQFIRPEKNLSTLPPSPDDLTVMYPTPPQVKDILARACLDCHSNNTRYPWYANVQPVAWWLADHVNEGKEELNISTFGTYPLKRQIKKLKELAKETQEGEMPFTSYQLAHADARLTDAEIQVLVNWADGVRVQLESR